MTQRKRISNIFKYQYLKDTDGYRYIFSPNFLNMTIGQWTYFFEMFSNINNALYKEWSPNDSKFYDWAVNMIKTGLAVYWCEDTSKEKYSIAVKDDIEEQMEFIRDFTFDNLIKKF